MKKIISLVLTVAMLFTVTATSVSAATPEEFLSEVALVYENSVEDARKAIEGTDWKLFEQDLNPDADVLIDDGVYLIYKTSTNVEDAITDLRVMDMYGGYSVSNYQKQLEASRDGYTAMVKDLRAVASEFKALYDEGDEMAKIAYRQMNYYKDVKTKDGTETDLKMGDFFLNMPKDEQVVQVFFEGNSFIIGSLLTLLAIGISGEDDKSLSSKVAEMYAIKDTLTDKEYYDDAAALSEAFTEIRAKILRYDALKEKYNLNDDEISDEEHTFINQVAALSIILEGIAMGETNLADFIRKGEYMTEDLYPIVAAFSPGQKLLIDLGQLETVLKYNAPTKDIATLNATLDETEMGMKDESGNINPVNVYLGVDRSIFRGTFAFTTAAERQQAITGETWDFGSAMSASTGFYIAAGVLAVVDLALIGAAIGIPIKVSMVTNAANAMMTTFKTTTDVEVMIALVDKAPSAVNYSKVFAAKYMPMVKPIVIAAIAVAMVVVGIVSISTWYNYYNPDYTEIPNTMIDVVSTSLGDKYVKYTAAKVFGDDGKKNADFNAYEGKEWIALYYTKDASAGNCLTPKFVYKDNDATIARRHQGVAMFGENKAFNLNSHVYKKGAPGVYLTVRYSTTKKSAANVPTVVGSMIVSGVLYTVTGVAGAGVGVGATLLIERAKKKKDEENISSELQ